MGEINGRINGAPEWPAGGLALMGNCVNDDGYALDGADGVSA